MLGVPIAWLDNVKYTRGRAFVPFGSGLEGGALLGLLDAPAVMTLPLLAPADNAAAAAEVRGESCRDCAMALASSSSSVTSSAAACTVTGHELPDQPVQNLATHSSSGKRRVALPLHGFVLQSSADFVIFCGQRTCPCNLRTVLQTGLGVTPLRPASVRCSDGAADNTGAAGMPAAVAVPSSAAGRFWGAAGGFCGDPAGLCAAATPAAGVCATCSEAAGMGVAAAVCCTGAAAPPPVETLTTRLSPSFNFNADSSAVAFAGSCRSKPAVNGFAVLEDSRRTHQRSNKAVDRSECLCSLNKPLWRLCWGCHAHHCHTNLWW